MACEQSNQLLIFLGYQYFFGAEYLDRIFGEFCWPASQQPSSSVLHVTLNPSVRESCYYFFLTLFSTWFR